MSEVLTGKGPQPPRVYWIRRGLVALIAVVLIGLLVWAFAPRNQPTTATPAPAASPSATQTVPSPTASPTGGVMPSSSGSPTATSTGPTACEAIGVQLAVEGFRSVKTGGRQVFSVTAENNTALPCIMEITKDTFVLQVTSGDDQIWSTAHCEKWLPTVKKQTLKAGASVEFKVNWTLYRSAEGCKQAKSVLGAGTYVATAAYKETAVDRMAFVITN